MRAANLARLDEGSEISLASLPEGWAAARLGEVVQPSKDKIEPREWPDAPYLSLEHIESRSGRVIGHGSARDVKSTKAVFRSGDVLYGKLRPYLNKVAIPDFDGVCSTDFLVFRRTASLDNRFLMSFLLRQEVVDFANHHSTGVQLPRVNFGTLGELDFPLPPLAEQKRIVEKVERLVARVNAAREHLDRVPRILKRFRQAVLAAACSGRLTEDWRGQSGNSRRVSALLDDLARNAINVKVRRDVPLEVEVPTELEDIELPNTWSMQPVASLLRAGVFLDVKDGNHGSNHPKAKELGQHGVPFITAAQVRNYRVDYRGAPKVDGVALERLRVGFANPGDALLTHKGTVGRAALNTEPCVLTPQTTYYRCNTAVLKPRYLVYFFSSMLFYSQLAKVMSQTTRDFVPISEQYRRFIAIPPPNEQNEIVDRVDALFHLVHKIEARVSAAAARAERLTQSVLAKAFRAELVPTEAELARREGRDYEPASVLLDRIEKQHVTVEGGGRTDSIPSRRVRRQRKSR